MNNNYIFPKDIRVSYYDGFPSKNDPIKIKTLYDVMHNDPGLANLNRFARKGSVGAFQIYVKNILNGTDADTFTDGIIGIDIDHISKTEAKTIYDNFEKLCDYYSGLLCCSFSNSYYDNTRSDGGIHLVVRTSYAQLNRDIYKEVNIEYAAMFAYVVYKLLGIDIRTREINSKKSGLDPAVKGIAHRFYLNYSTVKWFEYSAPMPIEEDKLQIVRNWFDEKYDNKFNWFERKSNFEYTKCEFNSINTSTYNGTKVDLGFYGRINIINALYKWGVSKSEIEHLMLRICGPSDWEGDKKEPGKLLSSIRNSISTAETQNPSASQLQHAKSVLESVGINVDVVIEKQLTDEAYESFMSGDTDHVTMSYDIDELVENAFEEAERRIKEKHIVINLREDEYINDYHNVIKEKIFKHRATYITADPGVGKTTLAERLTTNDEYEPMFGSDFFFSISGDDLSIDICMPYNSVVDSKALNNKQLKRVLTADLSNYDKDGIKIFVWNTLKPIYDKYFNMGYKRAVFFFDESHKIVTDIYRWKIIFEMFKVLPNMYNHFVFMTGTPAYEHIFLKQYFDDMCFIKINKDSKYTYNCTFRNYDKFSLSDMTDLIRHHLSLGNLPMIYTNRRRADWTASVIPLNEERIANGEAPLKVLYFNRDNKEDCEYVAKLKSIKRFDLVIATAYLNVGVDIYKDDSRIRIPIIDYANDSNSTYNEIWQFQGRNRQQDSWFEVICRTGDKHNKKKPAHGFNYYLYNAMLHTYDVAVDAETEDDEHYAFLNSIYKINKFGRLANSGTFKDYKNIVLLACYYMYIDKFTYIHNIKAILKNKGCKINEIDMTEHSKSSVKDETKKDVFKFYVEHIDEINHLQIDDSTKHKGIVKQIDLNTDTKDHICNGRIYSRDKRYMDWLYYTTANKEDWVVILRKCLEDDEILTKGTFSVYNKMKLIADNITDRELKSIKAAIDIDKDEEDDDHCAVDLVVEKIMHKHFKGAYSKKDIHTAIALSEIVNSYRDILLFIADNKEVIEIIKKHRADGTMNAAMQMKIIKDTKEKARLSRLHSEGAKKKNSKTITVRWIDTNEVVTYESLEALANAANMTKQNLNQSLKRPKSKIHNLFEIVSF